ncbi:hypothetical protein F3P51_11940 [Bacteroides fragilis]|uniref:Uncharacterized protein n=1 Tax=Bacteroides fragilis TaxID=817 RepID=A0A642KPY3_BACFG|nr:hypothetical protein F2Z40_15150 [Bacteroides fragilis]KAA5087058.1 hypothetical protein F2Z82_15375 [Bacteroides fragilis]KAA5090385.1 hypothetical protein F2Z45_13150 [Bacteroides fragilis]KAA5100983.1 hypothetical protein F2Z46_11435 [Bacteroides fragilis]KAA5103480.1 hypothetical protein F2Z51_14615 [Bacteroides fragilis]
MKRGCFITHHRLHRMIFNLLITHNIYLCKFHVICGEYEFWHTPFLFTLLCVFNA